jgi:5-methylcytosine-specific restriction endonuclease McrA
MSLLNRKVLILNADYRALSVCSVYKAFILVYLNKAVVVDKAKDNRIRTVTTSYDIPTVIKLHSYVSVPYKGVMLSRQNIFKRDNHKCVYCGSHQNLTLDHVLPRSRGGNASWTNLVTACKLCNAKKGDNLPEEVGMPLPYKPYKPSFVLFMKDSSSGYEESWKPFLA